MSKILRHISTQQRFFEIIDSMREPVCAMYGVSDSTIAVAENYNGICIYEYKPTKEELPEFEFKFKKLYCKGVKLDKINSLLLKKAALNSHKQQLEKIGIRNNENISKKIQEISEEINSLKSSEENKILTNMITAEAPEQCVLKTIREKLLEIEELPMGVYASFICILEKSKDYILKHNQNIKDMENEQ